jgi:hypothetical protein
MPLTNLNRKLDRNSRSSSPKKKKNWSKFFLKLFVLLLILFLVVYLPVRGVYQSVRQINTSAKAISAAVKNNNLDDIKSNVKKMSEANDSLSLSLNFLIWMRVIPYVGGFYADAQHFSKAAHYELNAAQTIVNSLEPYKGELGFNGQPSPGQDKIGQAVKILDKVIPQLDKIQPDLQKAAEEVSSIDVNKYPEKFGNRQIRSQVDTAKNFITGAFYTVSEARPVLQVAPSMLGQPTPKTYMLIFQNDKELRATGGFMTAYAFLTLDKGKISSTQSDDIYRLDEKLLQVCQNRICPLTPPAPIVRYLPEADGRARTAWSMRDSNISPDVPTSAKNFERMYDLLPSTQSFDGIIFIDTNVVEDLISITGPIDIFGTKYSADWDKRCNCPNVIYELENYAQIIEKGEQDRKAILGTLMQQLLARSLGASTERMPEFVNAGVKLANNKHIIFYMKDPKAQEALSQLGWTGEVKNTTGDYLMVNDSNFAGGKTNLYVTQEVNLDIDTNSKKHKLTINYKNPEKYGSWLNGINRDYVRVYVPQGSKLTASKGSDVQVTTIEEELGKTVFEAFIQVNPGGSRTLTFEYETPKDYQQGNTYPILIQKQPGTKDFQYKIKINGVQRSSFGLNTDENLKLSI